MLFTLSLPIRRRDLVLTRSMVGAVAAVALAYVPAVILAVVTRFTTTHPLAFSDALLYSTFLAAGGMMLYWLTVLFASFLDEQWQLYAGWLCGGAVIAMGMFSKVPGVDQYVKFSTGAMWIQTHSISWTAVGAVLALSIGFLVATLKIAEQREY
jgi:hypothetical protein